MPLHPRLQRLSFGLITVFCFVSYLTHAEITPQAAPLLKQVRSAVDYDALLDFQPGLQVEGHGNAMGEAAAFKSWFYPDGRFRNEIHTLVTTIDGFDGQKGWLVDDTGMPGYVELSLLETQKITAWVLTGYWLNPDFPMDIQPVDSLENALQLTISGGSTVFTLQIDGKSSLPMRLSWKAFGADCRSEFSDYRKVEGFRFPHRIDVNQGGETVEIDIDRISQAPDTPEKICGAITERPADTRYNGSGPIPVEFQRTMTGHLMVHPTVNGQDVGWFMFDTGAGRSVIDSRAAEKLELTKIMENVAAGVGGIVVMDVLKGDKLALGPVEISGPVFIKVDLKFIEDIFGIPIGGILGYDFLMRCPVEIDLADTSLILYELGKMEYPEAAWQEIIFNRNNPTIQCRFSDADDALFTIDSGAAGTINFFTDFAIKSGLMSRAEESGGAARGVGGELVMKTSTIDWFELGGRRFEALPVGVAHATQGAFADESLAGLIGVDLLTHFKMLVDYPNKRIGFISKD